MNKLQDTLYQGCEHLNIVINASQVEKIMAYITLLLKWNQSFNLTAIKEPEAIMVQHILDSLAIYAFIKGETILDIGTGAGLPGIPLAILYGDKLWSLLDSNGKKTRFLTQVALELNLKNIKVCKSRVEQYNPENLFFTITSRAFSSLALFVNLSQKLCHPKGYMLALKGKYPKEELAEISKDFKVEVVPLQVPFLNAERHVCIIHK